MPASSPKELRDRFSRWLREGLNGQEASRLLQVSVAEGWRWARYVRSTGVASINRPSEIGRLDAHVGFLLELARQDPDITHFESRDTLADADGVTVYHFAITAQRLKHLVSSTYASRKEKVSGGHRAPTCGGNAAVR